MKKILIGLWLATVLAAGISWGATTSSPQQGVIHTNPISVGGSFPYNGGPQSSVVNANGGTLTCTGGGTITVANTKVTANSSIVLTLKTVGGTVAAPFIATITAGTGFTVTCGGSDTSVYNYIILG